MQARDVPDMQAQDVMVSGVISVGPDIPVRIAANAMVVNCVSALPVINIYAKLVGIVSEGDLIRRVEIGTERRRSRGADETLMSSDSLAKEFVKSHAKRVSDVMTREVITAQPDWVESDCVLHQRFVDSIKDQRPTLSSKSRTYSCRRTRSPT